MGAIATVLRLSGRTLRHCLFLILMAFRLPIVCVLRLGGNLLLIATPVLAALFWTGRLLESSNPDRGLPILTVVICPIVGLVCLFLADGYDRLIFALQPQSTELFLPR